MKKLALILFLIPSLALSQDSLELKTINDLNKYRASKGLSQLVIDQGLCKAAEHQVKYEFLCDSVTHGQYQDFPDFQEIPEFEDRIRHFCGPDGPSPQSEITLGGGKRNSIEIIEWFKMSPGHDRAMTDKNIQKVGIEVVINKEYVKNGKKEMRFYCVIVFGI